MGAPDVLAHLHALGVRLTKSGEHLIAEPRSALTDELRAMIRAHKPELLAALSGGLENGGRASGNSAPGAELSAGASAPGADPTASAERKRKALVYLEEHPEAARVCFADFEADAASVIFTVAWRAPCWGVVEVLVSRRSFSAFQLMELAELYPATSLFVGLH